MDTQLTGGGPSPPESYPADGPNPTFFDFSKSSGEISSPNDKCLCNQLLSFQSKSFLTTLVQSSLFPRDSIPLFSSSFPNHSLSIALFPSVGLSPNSPLREDGHCNYCFSSSSSSSSLKTESHDTDETSWLLLLLLCDLRPHFPLLLRASHSELLINNIPALPTYSPLLLRLLPPPGVFSLSLSSSLSASSSGLSSSSSWTKYISFPSTTSSSSSSSFFAPLCSTSPNTPPSISSNLSLSPSPSPLAKTLPPPSLQQSDNPPTTLTHTNALRFNYGTSPSFSPSPSFSYSSNNIFSSSSSSSSSISNSSPPPSPDLKKTPTSTSPTL
ncbi:uncharacterized protein LOC135212410 [Macrobrachium nipponense]|uniref:uncharacterized protein LOC135212410 n=1 Tax=Macrobrachium nipponense TaxID=159736 RepID=UPI0030C84359